jgi:phosphoribosylformylglycinamidine (FGAM) synthase PurS component
MAEKLGNLVAETETKYLMNTNMEHYDYINII